MTATIQEQLAELIAISEKLADSVSFDMNGALIGGKWMGGHGGLISDDTMKAADEVRRVCHRLRHSEEQG